MSNNKIWIVIFLVALAYSCDKRNKLVTQEDFIEIIIETIKQDSIDLQFHINTYIVDRYICERKYSNRLGYIPLPLRNDKGEPFDFTDYKKSDNSKNGFEMQDSIFVTNQIRQNKGIVLTSAELKKAYQTIYYNNYYDNSQSLYTFLLPLFNQKKNYVIVEYDFTSEFVDIGYGRLLKFQKIENKWRAVEKYTTWH